jgi:hypothetical protein
MTTPYYEADGITLYLGDCLEAPEWLAADVLVTDPPYGIGYSRHGGGKSNRRNIPHAGILGDDDCATRDAALTLWGARPAVVFGSPWAAQPALMKQPLVWVKSPDSGVVGSTTGFRRDWEAVYLCGQWPHRPARASSVLTSGRGRVGGPSRGHVHSKPVDLMQQLIDAAPPGTIADPFAGSGSTLVAARLQGRQAIGVELEERYCEIAANRLAQGVLL